LALSIASSPSEGESSARSDEKSGAADVASRGWQIHEEDDSDWRSHAAAIARSIQLIKARLQVGIKSLTAGFGVLGLGWEKSS
jgi:peptide chain release factor 2